MSAIALLFGLGLQAPPVKAPANDLACHLVTPSGATIQFEALESEIGGESVRMVPVRATPWPQAVTTGTRQINLRPRAFALRAYGIGTGRNPLVIHFGTRLPAARTLAAVIYRATRRDAVLPLAHGSCGPPLRTDQPAAGRSSAPPVSADLLDPDKWLEENSCRVLRPDGRVETITYFAHDARTVTVSGGPFGPAPARARRDVYHSGAPVLASFSAPSGARGIETLFVYGNWAARLLRFDPPRGSEGQPVYGICGLRGLVRRPALG